MSEAFKVEVDASDALQGLMGLIDSAKDMEPMFELIGDDMVDHITDLFRQERTPDGEPWAELSEVTKMRRRGTEYNILRDTGILSNSIDFTATGKSVEVGSPMEYAATQNYGAQKGQYGRTKRGSPIPWGDIPAREFIPSQSLPQEWGDDITEICALFLKQALNRK